MKALSLLYVFIGSGLGGVTRFILSKYIQSPNGTFPKATLYTNTIACCILGVILGGLQARAQQTDFLYLLFAVGYCGGMSTFSTWSSEQIQLWQQGQYLTVFIYLLLSIILGNLALFMAFVLTQKLFS